jgi:hypothetical protein
MTGVCCCIASRSQRLSGEFGVGAHECIVDNFVARIDLAMSLALIVIRDSLTFPGEHGSDVRRSSAEA